MKEFLDNEEIILKDIIDKFSIREIALAYIKNIKKDLSPIEDVEDIYNSLNELRSIQKKYKYKKKGKKEVLNLKIEKKIKDKYLIKQSSRNMSYKLYSSC